MRFSPKFAPVFAAAALFALPACEGEAEVEREGEGVIAEGEGVGEEVEQGAEAVGEEAEEGAAEGEAAVEAAVEE